MEPKTDLLIIGGGAAGLSAAACAAELGASVVILESNPRTGGNGLFAEVMFALHSDLQKAAGLSCDTDEWFRLAMEHSHWKNNARLVRAMLETSGENMNWLCSHGLNIAGFQDAAGTTHYTEGNHTGREAIRVLQAFCEQAPNVEIHTHTKVNALIQDDSGAVIGAETESEGVRAQYFSRAVLVACGGFSGNAELAREIIPGIDVSAFAHLRGIRMEGSGIRLARSAGAEILSDGCFENAGPTFAGNQRLMSLVTKRYALWLNAQGRRFANEAVGDNFVYGCNAVYRQPGHFCYVLLSEAMIEKAVTGPVDFLAGPEAVLHGTAGIKAAIETEAAAGNVCYTDSLENLAAWMHIPAEALQASLDEYNTACETGRDEIFLKPAELLVPLGAGPYLAIRCGVDQILTHGGIRVNEHMQAERPDGSVIPGLYAAGADISGLDANGYQVSMGGHSLGFSMTGGRIAAHHVCGK